MWRSGAFVNKRGFHWREPRDPWKILPEAESGDGARNGLSARLQEIKGIGPVGVGIFLGSIQQSFPNVAPFLDDRSRRTAEQIGLGDDVDTIFAALDHCTYKMARLEVASSKIRLEKREEEFQ
jgi:hypothetical protein